MLASLIVPAAGLFRHNETLWARISAAQKIVPFELIIPTYCEISPRLNARIEQLAIAHKFVVIPSPHVGALFQAGTELARGEWCIWLHDDALPEHVGALIQRLTEMPGLNVPIVKRSHNVDQAEGSPFTTRPIDRCCLAFETEVYRSSKLNVSEFAIDGYQVAVQYAFAELGHPVFIQGAKISHEGSQTLCNGVEEDYEALFAADMRKVSAVMGTYAENRQRPAIPRIIPRGLLPDGHEGGPVDVTSPDVHELVNLYDAEEFKYKGKTYGRVNMGDRYSIPPIMDTYDVALIDHMGLGDALMHTSAVWHFKQLYPHVQFRCFSYGSAAYISSRSSAWDEVITLQAGEMIPSAARVWNVANGTEGTPHFGFRELGIESLVPMADRRMAPYKIGPDVTIKGLEDLERPNIIGIQLNGGWVHKRYAHVEDLVEELEARGFSPVYFGTVDGLELSDRYPRIHTPTLDDFAYALQHLRGWIGFDSGASYLANSIGIPAVMMFASHDPAGLIGGCGANAPYDAIWPAKPHVCAKKFGISCREIKGAAFKFYGSCGLRDGAGADCLDEISPRVLVDHVVNLLSRVTK